MAKRYNPNLAKKHYSYSVREIADLYRVHKNTVLAWIRDGLPTIDNQRPICVQGNSLREYLTLKNAALKRPCKIDELYCFKCRKPQRPAGGMVDYLPDTNKLGQLQAMCSVCHTILHKFSSIDKLVEIRTKLEVTVREP